MSRKFTIAYFAHSIRSDWNNGNAHFLRGLLRSLAGLGHDVTIFEPSEGWSLNHLLLEPDGERSLEHFAATYPDLIIRSYEPSCVGAEVFWRKMLAEVDTVIVHEWNTPALISMLLELRPELHFRMLFHDTHHRASSSPEQIRQLGIPCFDGVLAFGEALRTIYREKFGLKHVWTLHEAADTTVFKPLPDTTKSNDLLWIGNWGDDERSAEIAEFLLRPASEMRQRSICIYGVRYPEHGLAALSSAGVRYGGYLPNLQAPAAYAASRLTIHIPRQQYASAMAGIPTIRVFEALACGVPLISAPWVDCEELFREGDFLTVHNKEESQSAIDLLMEDHAAADAQAARGLSTVLERHTCEHRAQQLTSILEGLFA